MVTRDRPRHPSGRPRRETEYRRLSITRSPGEGALVPRLNQRGLKDAIGFVARLEPDDEDCDG